MTIPESDSSSNQRQRQFPITPLFSINLLYKQMPFGQGYSEYLILNERTVFGLVRD